MRGRQRRQERHDERQTFGRGGGATRYRMHEKLVSIGDDYWIENDQGQRVFKVDGKAMRIRDTLQIENLQGQELVKIQEKKLRVRDTMDVEGPGGETLAEIVVTRVPADEEDRPHADKVRILSVLHEASLVAVRLYDLPHEDVMSRHVDRVRQPAFHVDRTLLDHRGGLQGSVEGLKQRALVRFPA